MIRIPNIEELQLLLNSFDWQADKTDRCYVTEYNGDYLMLPVHSMISCTPADGVTNGVAQFQTIQVRKRDTPSFGQWRVDNKPFGTTAVDLAIYFVSDEPIDGFSDLGLNVYWNLVPTIDKFRMFAIRYQKEYHTSLYDQMPKFDMLGKVSLEAWKARQKNETTVLQK